MKSQKLAELLVKHGIVDIAAVYDPGEYDNYKTLDAIKAVAREIDTGASFLGEALNSGDGTYKP